MDEPNTPAPVNNGATQGGMETPSVKPTGRDSVLDVQPDAPTQDSSEDWSVPEAYKDKAWAKDIKSLDELYEKMDLFSDPVSAFDTFKPENADSYEIPEAFADEADDIKAMLFEMGLPPEIANERVLKVYAEYQAKKMEAAVSEEGFDAEMKRVFGDKYEAAAGEVTKMVRSALTPEQFEAFKQLPNQYIGFVYEMMSKVQKQYGVKELGGGGKESERAAPNVDPQEARQAVMAELKALDRRPHTQAERQAILDKLNSI